MIIGIIYGGRGAEEFSNSQAIKEIGRVLEHYNINYKKIYLNNKKLSIADLTAVDLFFMLDSNCVDYSIRQKVSEYIRQFSKEVIGQNQTAFALARNKYESNKIFSSNFILTPKFSLLTLDSNSSLNLVLEKVISSKKTLKISFRLSLKTIWGLLAKMFFIVGVLKTVSKHFLI